MDLQDIDSLDVKLDETDRVIEALIAASDKPAPDSMLMEVIKDCRYGGGRITRVSLQADLENTVLKLNGIYAGSGLSFRIERIGGGYRMMTLPEYDLPIRKYLHPIRQHRLSKPALETLAVIAYRQPVTRMQIEKIRGVAADGVVRTLLDKKMIKISGRAEGPGRPLLYATTDLFLEYFGLNDLSELPSEDEIEVLLGHRESAVQTRITMEKGPEGTPDEPSEAEERKPDGEAEPEPATIVESGEPRQADPEIRSENPGADD